MVFGSGRSFRAWRWAGLLVFVGLLAASWQPSAIQSLAQEGGATPGAVDFAQVVTERPAEIISGSCDEGGELVAVLTPLTIPEGEAQGQGQAIEAERSYSVVPVPIADLLAGQTSVRVLLSAEESDTTVACGEIGGVPNEGGSLVIKLSERNGSGFTGIAFLAPDESGSAGVSLFLGGERSVAESRELAASTPSVDLETIAAPTPTVEPVQVIDVALLEWVIDAPAEIRAGQVNFVVTNEGAESHRLVIESGGAVVAELAEAIGPDQSAVLQVTLAPGEYLLYCPLDEGAHRMDGMESTLTVAP